MQALCWKAELRDTQILRGALQALGAPTIVTVRQTDTHHDVASGRMIHRRGTVLSPGGPTAEPDEVIFYTRADRADPAICHFQVYSPEEARVRFGVLPIPVRASVAKTRGVHLAGAVSVMVDEVDGLGAFVELAILVTPRQTLPRAHREIRSVRAALRPALGEPVSGSYADLVGDLAGDQVASGINARA